MAGETGSASEAVPESVDVAGAVAMLEDDSQLEEAERAPEPVADVEAGEPADGRAAEADVDVEADPQTAIADETPEFWSV